MASRYVAPEYKLEHFTCPNPQCQTLTKQDWIEFRMSLGNGRSVVDGSFGHHYCTACRQRFVWALSRHMDGNVEVTTGRLVYPDYGASSAPAPAEGMPDDVRDLYEEARSIADRSPRAASGLLRVAVQHLVAHLGASESNLGAATRQLQGMGVDRELVRLVDVLRVYGNDALHPEQLLEGKPETATSLFMVLNYIVEQAIAEPERRRAMYDRIPEAKRTKELPPG